MTAKRLSSFLTFWFAWVLPLLSLPFWTLVSISLLVDMFEPYLTIFVCLATIVLWAVYLITKPWTLKHIYHGNRTFIFKENGHRHIITYKQVRGIYPVFWTKYSPVVIEYKDKGNSKNVSFIPRQSKVLLLLPFFQHPIVKELNEELTTGANSTLPKTGQTYGD